MRKLKDDRRFIYRGWNQVAEFWGPYNGGAFVSTYSRQVIRGMDLAGPGQRAGGIGGVLMVQEGGESYLPAYDALGNVHAMIKASDGSIAAAYEYDAYGRTLRESGPYAAANPFRFSTKYTDNETGLVYHDTRYYSQSLGRFINRDTIGEQGGLNLYAYVRNRVPNAWDYLGMSQDIALGNGLVELDGGGGSAYSIFDATWSDRLAQYKLGDAVRADAAARAALGNDEKKIKAINDRLAQGESVKVIDANGNTHVLTPGQSVTFTHGSTAISIETIRAVAPNSTGGVSRLTTARLSQGIRDPNFTGADGYTMVAGSLVDDGKTGLRTAVFSNGTNNVQVFAGTSPSSLANWWANLTQALGFESKQYKLGMQLAKDNYNLYEGNLSFAGHSLGGGIAAAAAIITGGSAVTFNAAGVHNNTIGDFSRSNGSVTSYYSTFDALRVLNALTPTSASVHGQRISLGAAGLHGMTGIVRALERGGP